jgi:hypothetical protein
MVKTYKQKFNATYGFPPDTSHSIKDIAKLTGYKLSGLKVIFEKGIGAYKTNPESVRPQVKSPEQWAMARIYSAVMGGKASKIDASHLISVHTKMKLLYIQELYDDKKKFVAVFSDGKRVKFGASGYDDYTISHDKKRREAYRKRHAKDLLTDDPTKPGFLSYFLLWGDSTSIEKNIASFRKQFGL